MAVNDNELAVRITADPSGVKPGTDATKSEIAALAPFLAELNASFKDLSSQISASMTQGAKQTAEMQKELHRLEEETEAETRSLKEMVVGVHEGVESFNSFKGKLKEIGEVWMAAFAVERVSEWAKEFAEASENIEHLAQRFGMSTAEVMGLNVLAKQTGISLESITRAMQVMDMRAVQAAQGTSAVANAFKAVGISANDGRSQIEQLASVADKFADMADGPKKVALAMELFGRNGAELIPILDRGGEAMRAAAEEAKKYSAAYTELSNSAQEKGVALAESINESGVAWQGITNVLGDAFGPMLKEMTDRMNGLIKAFIDSYNEGGVVAVTFGALKVVIETVGAAINLLAGVFKELWDVVVEVASEIGKTIADLFGIAIPTQMKSAATWVNVVHDAFTVLKDTVIIVVEIIRGHIEVLVGLLQAFAKVAHDAFTLQWDKVAGDWQAGMDHIATMVEATGNRIAKAAGEMSDAIAAAIQGKRVGGEPKEEKKEPKSHGFDPDLGATPKQKKSKDDLVQQLDEQLKAKQVAWAMEQDAQGTAQEYSLQSIADYWKAALERDGLSQKDRLAIEEKYLAAHGELVKQQIEGVLAGYKIQLDAAKGASSQRLAIAEQEAAYVGRMYGLQSNQYKAAQDQIVRIKREAVQQERELQDEIESHQAKLQLDAVNAADAAAQHRVKMGLETENQLLAQQREFENQRYAIEASALERRKVLIDPTHDPIAYQKIIDQIELLETAHQAKLTQIQQQATIRRTQIERDAITQTSNVWATNMAKMITLQQGLGSTIRSIYSGMVDVISGALTKVIEQWIAQHLAALALKHTTQAVDGAAAVTSNAGIAASAAYASTAAIPVVGPELAPAAAATAAAAAMSFLPMASASGGFDIPAGVNPLTQLHAQEMVLPASLANPLRSMIASGGAANGNSPAPANDGGFHYHDHTGTLTPDQIVANRAAVAKAVKMAHREGHFAGARVGF